MIQIGVQSIGSRAKARRNLSFLIGEFKVRVTVFGVISLAQKCQLEFVMCSGIEVVF